jgi:hypothetical protein
MSLATSLGLLPSGGSGAKSVISDDVELFDDDEFFDGRAFCVDCAAGIDLSGDFAASSQPTCGGVFIEGNEFDEKAKTCLIVRVAKGGHNTNIGVPVRETARRVTILVTRTNAPDFVSQLVDPITEDVKKTELRVSVARQVQDKFGGHFDYELLNNAFRRMVPEAEEWTIEVTLQDPWLFGQLKDSLQFTARDAMDTLFMFPVEKELAVVKDEIKIVNLQ